MRCRLCGAPFPTPNATACDYCGAGRTAGDTLLGDSICIALPDGMAMPLLVKGRPLPLSLAQELSTQEDDQPSITVRLVVGVGLMADDLRELFKATLPLGPGRRGAKKVDLGIAVDPAGVVHVALEERGTDNRVERDDLRVPIDRPEG
ncbi:MAG TPA: hypothetical protein RMF84_14905 [Polyangiaceae bacterium LLY-WYZ-14_1]|nr:hypothetical protein [Polyangiaceae bacterium LLY-WYZ-14_1]